MLSWQLSVPGRAHWVLRYPSVSFVGQVHIHQDRDGSAVLQFGRFHGCCHTRSHCRCVIQSSFCCFLLGYMLPLMFQCAWFLHSSTWRFASSTTLGLLISFSKVPIAKWLEGYIPPPSSTMQQLLTAVSFSKHVSHLIL